MHTRYKRSIITQALISSLCVLSAVSASAQDWRAVRNGIEYAEVTRTIDNQPVRMNLLRLDLKKVRLDVVHALDAAIGTETVSSLAKRHGAFAAINAGFFRLDKSEFAGDDVGYLLIDRMIWSEPALGRSVMSLENEKKETLIAFNKWSFVGYLRWKSRDVPGVLKGFNREVNKDEVVAFTPAFGERTFADTAQTQVIVQQKRVLSPCSRSCKIPKDGFVLAGNGAGAEFLRNLKIGDRVQYVWDAVTDGNDRPSFKPEDAVAGVPQLVKDGKVDITWQEEKASRSFVETRHPRTAVAKLKDGKFLMITVDGRSESSGGISLYDLAAYLLELGATDAMNFDGGGSTTMYLDGKVVNRPSDKEGERKVSDAIIVTLRKK